MSEITLLEGPVGAGKSTYGAELAGRGNGIHIALDAWFSQLFSPDRPAADVIRWYGEHKERLVDLIWEHALALSESGVTPILELGLVQRDSRAALYQRADAAGVGLRVLVFEAPREIRRERVERRNHEQGPTYSMTVPDTVFEMASDMWQAPEEDEIARRNIDVIVTG